MEQIEIALQLGPDDPVISSHEFQAELAQFSDGLNTAGIDFSQPMISLNAVEAARSSQHTLCLSPALHRGVTPGLIGSTAERPEAQADTRCEAGWA